MKIEISDSISNMDPRLWQDIVPPEFPFVDYQFLLALEQTACLGKRTGWAPLYITCWQDHSLLGAFLVFSKNNSYGEYIFDFAWAQAYESYGLAYYPKLVAAIPFTPATGPKILLSKNLTVEEKSVVSEELLVAAKKLLNREAASSIHALFLAEEEVSTFQKSDFLIRHSFQYHWSNNQYKNFDDFLQNLRGKRRREILRERAQVRAAEIQITQLTSDQLRPDHAQIMHQFYSNTVEKMGGFPYLTADFFHQVFKTMKDKILFVLAIDKSERPVAGALNYLGSSTLFGRHWGCLEEYKSLHFEVCYYQGIEFAIEKKFKLFEAGAQGSHKFNRGFLPCLTYSAHQIKNPQMSKAIEVFVKNEKKQIEDLFADYKMQTPFSVE